MLSAKKLGFKSSQLTNNIFQRGGPTTNQLQVFVVSFSVPVAGMYVYRAVKQVRG